MLGVFVPCAMKILVSSSRPQSPDHMSDASVPSRTLDGSLAPVVDFSHPPEFSSCLDNSAAKHKLLVKPRNQRSSKLRRLASVIGLPPLWRDGAGRHDSPTHCLVALLSTSMVGKITVQALVLIVVCTLNGTRSPLYKHLSWTLILAWMCSFHKHQEPTVSRNKPDTFHSWTPVALMGLRCLSSREVVERCQSKHSQGL